MIKNIVFDLGGVILKEKPISVLDNRVDIVTYNELKRFFDGITELDTGNISLEELFNKCNFKKELIMKYKDVLIHYYKYRELNNEILELISKLKEMKYSLELLRELEESKNILNDGILQIKTKNKQIKSISSFKRRKIFNKS